MQQYLMVVFSPHGVADTEDGGDLPRKRRKSQEETGIEEEPERCMKAYTGNKHGLGMSVEHKAAAQGKK